jgi:RNA polymerase sigma-70 factor, ECF subfamily
MKLRICSDSEVPASEKPDPRSLSDSAHPPAPIAENLDELVRAHSPYVAGLAYRLLGRDADVDDVVQDVFVSLFRFGASVRDPGAVRGWLATTTVRLAQRRLRARSSSLRRWLGLEEREPAAVTAAGAGAEEHLELARIHRALASVPPQARVAWILRYVEQEQTNDVARLIGCSLTTTKRRIEAAQIAVKRALGDG